jgi:hypothetical protein
MREEFPPLCVRHMLGFSCISSQWLFMSIQKPSREHLPTKGANLLQFLSIPSPSTSPTPYMLLGEYFRWRFAGQKAAYQNSAEDN